MRLLPEKELIVIDLETTDIALADTVKGFPELVEIGAVLIDGSAMPLKEFSLIVRPTSPELFSMHSERYTGLTSDILADAKPLRETWREFAEFTKFNHIRLAAWGIGFDFPVLKQAYRRADLGFPHAVPMIDILSLVYAISGEWGYSIPRWSLKEACKRFDLPVETKHRGLSGAKAAVNVLHRILRLDNGTADQEEPPYGLL